MPSTHSGNSWLVWGSFGVCLGFVYRINTDKTFIEKIDIPESSSVELRSNFQFVTTKNAKNQHVTRQFPYALRARTRTHAQVIADINDNEQKEYSTMNILITLPKHLIDAIIKGEKKYEMRKSIPKNLLLGRDGFFVVEKGTSIVRCWCRVDTIYATYLDHDGLSWLETNLCVSRQYIEKYAGSQKFYLWKIAKVIKLKDLDRSSLFVDKNPQSYAYCPFSCGQSY